MPLASLGDDISSFFNAVGKFFSSLADIHFGALLIALVAFGIYLTIRSRAAFHILRAAYPDERDRVQAHLGAPTSRPTASTTSSPRAAATSSGCS